MKIVVYSVNIGGYDDLWTPKVVDPNVRYILFTDNKYFKSNVWEINHVDFLGNDMDNRLKSRYVKTHPHIVLPNHDVSVWIDNCFSYKFSDTKKMVEEIGITNNLIMCYKHDVRDCLYDEAKVIKSMKLDYSDVVDSQMNKYREEGFPKKMGLYQSGFMVRKNIKNVNNFNNTWWEEIKSFSGRDQLSQVYSSWKTETPITPITNGGDVYNNKYLNPKIKHLKKWSI
jgi:hypothetical protein